jgi:hypothetical protein
MAQFGSTSGVRNHFAFSEESGDHPPKGQYPDDTGGSTGEAVATQNPRIKLVEESALPFWISRWYYPDLGALMPAQRIGFCRWCPAVKVPRQ